MNEGVLIIVFLVGFFAAAFVVGGMMNDTLKIYSNKGSILPCDKIVTITDKYQKATEYGGMPHISNIIVIGGREIPFHNNFALDGGIGEYNQIPLNTTVILSGAEDIHEGMYVSKVVQVNVRRSETISNACVVI